MSLLAELTGLLSGIAPIETGVFSDAAPDEYIVITPLADTFALFGDNKPDFDEQEARISIFSRNNYLSLKNRVIAALLTADFTVTARRYIEREDRTGYFHYTTDVLKIYPASDAVGDQTEG